MSQENVEVVRRSLEAYRRGDLDAALAHVHPKIVWSPYEEPPMHGVDAVRTYLRRWEGEWEELETTPEEFIDAGEQVVAVIHFRGRGRGSGIEVEARSYSVYTVRDDKTVRMEEFIEREDALEAAGLSGR
jgi:ketosteroid isomerase-like protein